MERLFLLDLRLKEQELFQLIARALSWKCKGKQTSYCSVNRMTSQSVAGIFGLSEKFEQSPIWPRVLPFAVFVGLTALQGRFGPASPYWIYFLKTLVGLSLIWMVRPWVPEIKWNFSWEAVVVGFLVFFFWVGLDPSYRKMGKIDSWWNPFDQFGKGSTLGWFFVTVRILGSTFVVPVIEEVFYRSFLYRYLYKPDFLKIPLGHYSWASLLFTSLIFGFSHYQWFAGILCAIAYQWLVIHKQRLGDAITAHAITNFLLGVWVVTMEDWIFW